MTPAACLLLVVFLATRLPLLIQDRAIRPWQAAAAGGLQGLATILLLQGSGFRWVLALAFSLGNLAWYLVERKTQPPLHAIRLAFLAGGMTLVVLGTSPGFGLEPRDLRPLLAFLQPWFSPAGWLSERPWEPILVTTAGLLLCLHEANLAIRLALDRLGLRPAPPDAAERTAPVISQQELRRGRIIGVLERIILFTLVLGGQYAALGFVVTAKAMARFKTLEDRDFAEYFLIGTLLSVLLAGGLALVVRAAL